MNTQEFSRFLSENRSGTTAKQFDEAAVKEIAQLVSGSLVYRLYEHLLFNDFAIDAVTEHLEMLYNTQNHFALLYYVFLLCDGVEVAVPEQYHDMTANAAYVPYLSTAIIEDWLDFHGDYGN